MNEYRIAKHTDRDRKTKKECGLFLSLGWHFKGRLRQRVERKSDNGVFTWMREVLIDE